MAEPPGDGAPGREAIGGIVSERPRSCVAERELAHRRAPVATLTRGGGQTGGWTARTVSRAPPDLLTIPFQDLFGWPDRINVPAVVDDRNWTWKLPWPVDALTTHPEAAARAATLQQWARRHGRGTGRSTPQRNGRGM